MCFSADASLAAGVLLIPAGAYSIVDALRKNWLYLPLAATPLHFSVQQFCEAFVWMGFEDKNVRMVQIASLLFLFFAIAFWPFWIPFSAAVLESRRGRKRLFFGLAAGGLLVGGGCHFALVLRHDEWLAVSVEGHSIRYDLSRMPLAQAIAGVAWEAMYLALVCVPPLISRERRLRALGLSVAISAVMAHVAFHSVFASVWCFFAAFLSLQICYVLRRVERVQPAE